MKCFISVILVFILVGIADAGVKQGDVEISVAAFWQKQNFGDGVSVDTATTVFGVGYFFTDELELSLATTGSWASSGDVDEATYNVVANLK